MGVLRAQLGHVIVRVNPWYRYQERHGERRQRGARRVSQATREISRLTPPTPRHGPCATAAQPMNRTCTLAVLVYLTLDLCNPFMQPLIGPVPIP